MPGLGRGRKDAESDNGTDSHDDQVTFETHRDEGEHFIHVKHYKRAIASFTKALDMQEGDKTCLVRRSNCYLMLGNAEAALNDANECLDQDEDGKKDIKALCMKAEALYQKGDFETALVYYHRGNKLRPELQEFRLGIQKSQEAINNSIGTPDSVQLETTGDLSYFYKQEEKQKQQQSRGYAKPHTKKEYKKEKVRPQTSSNSKTTKELLGELYADKDYLEKLYDSLTTATSTTNFIKDKAVDGLHYLGVREDFWRQQKPMYARKRDKQKQTQALGGSTSKTQNRTMDPMKYILTRLEQIDEDQSNGHYEDSLKKCQKTMKRVEEWTEDEVKNKQEVIANLHSCMGNAYLELGKHDDALKHHQIDLDIGKEQDLEEVKSRAFDNLGRVLARMGKFKKAIEIWEEKLPLSKTPLEKTWLFHEIGRCYLEIQKYGEARDYGEKSLAAAKEADDGSWQLHATVLVAQSEVKLNELQAASDSFERALEMAQSQNDSAAEEAIKKALDDVNDKIVKGVNDEKDDDREDGTKDNQDDAKDGEEKNEEDYDEDEGSKSPKVEVESSKEDKHDTKNDNSDIKNSRKDSDSSDEEKKNAKGSQK